MSTDFTMKQHVDPTAIAALAQRQAQMQADQDNQAKQRKLQELQTVAQSVGTLVSSSIEESKKRQKDDMVKNLADSMAARVPNVMASQQGPVMDGQGALPAVSTPDTMGQNAVRASVMSDPAPWTKQLADQLIQSPVEQSTMGLKNQTAALDFAKSKNEAAKFSKGQEPVSQATKQLITAAHQKAGLPAPDFATMSEDRGQQVYNDAIKLASTGDKSLGLSDKQEQFDEKMMVKLDDRLNWGKSNRGANGQAAAALRGIGQLDALFKGYKNDLTAQEWEEASIAWARILSSGGNGAARAQIEALIPPSAVKNVQVLKQWISNNPTGTKQQEFAKRMEVGMDREKTFNEGYLKKETLKVLDGYKGPLSRQNPDDLREFFQNKGLSYDDVKTAKPALAKRAWPEGKPKEAAVEQGDQQVHALASMLGLKKKGSK